MDSHQGCGKRISSLCLLLTEIHKAFWAGAVLIAVRWVLWFNYGFCNGQKVVIKCISCEMMRDFLLSRAGSFGEVFRAHQTDDISLLFSTSLGLIKYVFFAFLTGIFTLLHAVLYSVNILPFFMRSRSDLAWIIFLFNQGGSLECFTRLWRIDACLLLKPR